MNPKTINRFIVFSQITLVFVFLVIIAGSVVRATGSGMGCPDWPKCFGKWIPPTDVSQLPVDYQEIYAGEHHAVEEFNALNTWTEYINRLVGAILGILIFIQLILSFPFRKTDKFIFVLSIVEFLLIGFQGWLGAKVVSSNLAPVKITIHMVMALVILSVGLIIIQRSKRILQESSEIINSPTIKKLAIVVLLFSIIQIMLGTQVRESVDLMLKNFDAIFRDQIVEHLGVIFKTHRSFSLLILVMNAWLIYEIIKVETVNSLKKSGKILGVLLLIEIAAGVVLARFALPAALQPVHLLLACLVFAIQFSIAFKVWK